MRKRKNEYYIYEIYNPLTDMYYIGQRKLFENDTPETDNYFGSSAILRLGGWHQGKYFSPLSEIEWKQLKKTILHKNIKNKLEIDNLEKIEIEKYRKIFGKNKIYNQQDGGNGGDMGENAKLKAKEKKLGSSFTSKRSYEIKNLETNEIYNSITTCYKKLKIRKSIAYRKCYYRDGLQIIDPVIEERRRKEYELYLSTFESKRILRNKLMREKRAERGLKNPSEKRKGKTYEEFFGEERAKQYKERLKNSLKDKYFNNHLKWFTDGIINKKAEICPDGFHLGKVNIKKGSKLIVNN